MSEEFIVARLKQVQAVTDLIAHRIFPGVAPTGSQVPYVTYNRITTPRVRSTKGLSGLASPLYQIDAWARDAVTAKAIMKVIIAALDGYKGTLAGVRVGGVITEDESSGNDPESGLCSRRGDFTIWHNE